MNASITEAIWRRTTCRASSRLLLLALARLADEEGRVQASVTALARLTGLGERYVRGLLRELAEAGDLRLESHPGDRRRRTYRFVKYLSVPRDTDTAVAAAPPPPSPPPIVEPAPRTGDETRGSLDIPSRLRALASSLPQDLPARSRWLDQLQELGAGERSGGVGEVEEALGHLDQKLLEEVESQLSPEARYELARQVELAEQKLQSWFTRMLPAEVARVRARLRRQELRRKLELPELSLFAPEAEP